MNRPASAANLLPMESKYWAICSSGMIGRALIEHCRDQGSASGGFGAVGQRAAQEGRLNVDQRQLRVPFYEHAQAVGKAERFDLVRPAAGLFFHRLGSGAGRENRHLIEPLGQEILPGNIANLFGGHLLNIFHINFFKLRIARAQ